MSEDLERILQGVRFLPSKPHLEQEQIFWVDGERMGLREFLRRYGDEGEAAKERAPAKMNQDGFDWGDEPPCRKCGRILQNGACPWCSDIPPAHRNAPVTSGAAAAAVAPKAGTLRRQVYDAYERATDGLTEEECQDATGLPSNTVRPRIWELRGQNGKGSMPAVLRDSGKKRKTKSGSWAVVWELIR